MKPFADFLATQNGGDRPDVINLAFSGFVIFAGAVELIVLSRRATPEPSLLSLVS